MLTPRLKQIRDFIAHNLSKNDVAPTEREIASRFGISPSTTHEHIETLRARGYLEKIRHRARGIKISDAEGFVKIPLLGTIAAGQPIEAIETSGETITIARKEIGNYKDYYALRVKGDSMVNEGIFNGDIVVIRKQETANDGQTVVAIIDDNEATLKKIYREKNRFRLQPANQNLLPLFRKEVEIRGIVIKIIRNLENGFTNNNDSAEEINLNNPFFNSQLITYIGNKRRLLPFLYQGFSKIRNKLGKRKLTILDGFAGSGAVARLLKYFADELYVNDFENYTETINRAYLANKSETNAKKLGEYIDWLNQNKLKAKSGKPRFIEKNYAPKNDGNIQPGERVFYTNTNAKIIDNLRLLIDEIPEQYRHFCLASLLVKASIHTNTSGVFKGFHKNNGNGHFGGRGENALSRIKKEINLDMPIFSDFECPTYIYKKNVNELVKDKNLPMFDLVYYDPPYNQHPYGSNYFMLNIINSGKPTEIQDGVSGIAKEWNRSAYNKSKLAEEALDRLLSNTRALFIAISYNDEGIIPIETFKELLSRYGRWELMEQNYNTYRGSRNLRDRDIKVKELLWILEKR